jgi:pyruvate/2-oxoglutarate dehydrogenase complex dihydrolipoamide acyltransferase (E2) component
MPVELTIPAIGESVTEAQIGDWLKEVGEPVRQDEPVVLLETDKAALELPAPVAGVLTQILKQKGEMVRVGDVIAYLEAAAAPEWAPVAAAPAASAAPAAPPRERALAPSPPAVTPVSEASRVMPAAQRLLAEHAVGAEQVTPTGPGGRLLKEDVLRHLGKTEEELQAAGIAYRKGVFPFRANGRARALGQTEGQIKVLAHAKTDRVLGVHILGPRAGDLIAEAAAAMAFGASSEDVARTCHAHPTLAEAFREAALAVDGRRLH